MMFDSLALVIESRARTVVAVAAVFFLFAAAFGASVASRLEPYGADDPASEAVRAQERLEAAGLWEPQILVVVRHAPIEAASTRRRVVALERALRQRQEVRSVSGYFDTGAPAFLSLDRRSTYLAVVLKATGDKEVQEDGAAVADSLADRPDLVVGGLAVVQEQVNQRLEEDLRKAEMVAFPLIFLLSLLLFRSVVAALLPLAIGALAIVGTFLILRLASEFASFSIFALNIATALGFALSIDYSLFVVSRYREEIAEHGPGSTAMRRVMATSGRTVFFSSLTVAAALASLLVFPQRFLYSTGVGGAAVALLAAFIALTVLPAILTLLGSRVDAGAPAFLQRRAAADARPDEAGFWYRFSRLVMRRPLPIATLSGVLLILLGLPFLGIKFNSVDPTALPREASARQLYGTLTSEFPPHQDSPVWIAVDGGGPGAAPEVAAQVRAVAGVSRVAPPLDLRDGVVAIQAIVPYAYYSDASRNTVRRIREIEDPPGTSILVGGAAADFVDFQASLARHLPYALGLLVAATLVLLFLFTGSVVLPLKTLIMNILNLSAVFGILVLIFQDGRFESLLDYDGTGAIDQSMPILLFATAFGLSTDYAVFLLSRIKEARDGGFSDSESVAVGLERSGRVVTSAALLFAVAAGAFAISGITVLKANGIGTALAVLIDASIVRLLLVPSLMKLLGRWNWWAPAPLRRLHDRFGLRG
jgi:uncharacterized membrane protein YdfJ with MMPL/SSD domain